MCFISFRSISGSINLSDGTIFDVYFFSGCLNENLLFLQNDFNPFQICRTKLHIGKTNPASLEEIHLSAKKRQQKVFFWFTFGIFMQGK